MITLRILFVDDEPSVLEGLERALFHRADVWDVQTAGSAEAAMKMLAVAPVDVVVTDMQMPGTDGAELLRQVHAQYPDTVRVVLSGHTKLRDALKVAPFAHQFLAKPCGADQLEKVIERACALRELTTSEAVRAAVGNVAALPPVPRLYHQLSQMLEDPEVGISDVAALIESDPAISAKSLQLANSPLFCGTAEVTRLRDAVSRLGIAMVRNIALAAELFQPQGSARDCSAPLDAEATRATQVALVAASVFDRASGLRDPAYMAGLLHGVGRLVLWTVHADWQAQVAAHVREQGCSDEEAERALFGADQAGVGGYLLGVWGLPAAIVEAVAYHRRPADPALARLDLVAAVHLGYAVASGTAPDPAYLGMLADSDEAQRAWMEDARASVGLHKEAN